jgi:hypothetical protein
MGSIWPKIQGRCPTTLDDLKAATQMSTRLTRRPHRRAHACFHAAPQDVRRSALAVGLDGGGIPELVRAPRNHNYRKYPLKK